MRRTTRLAGTLALLLLLAACRGAPIAAEQVPPPPFEPIGDAVTLPDDPRRWFDFWVGAWNVTNHHLRDGAWVGSGEALARIWAVADGGAVVEQWNGELGGDPLIGFSLRAWDPELEAWSIWLNWHGGQPDGFSEMHGTRNGGRIEQFPPGNTEAIRYSFSETHRRSARWDQAQSRDGGETWQTNWIMQFRRREFARTVDASNAPIVTPPETPAEFEKTRRLDHLIGAWAGPATASGEENAAVTARVTSMLEGYGLLQFVDIERDGRTERTMMALGWDKRAKGWVALRVDDGPAGIRKLLLEPGSRSEDVAFATDGAPWLRERWRCATRDDCRWTRETSDDGRAWTVELEATLAPTETR